MIRRVLLILFLYVLLAWTAAAYFNLGDPKKIVSQGLFWTVVGIAAMLVFLIVERSVSAWRARRSQAPAAAAPQPAAGAPPAPLPGDQQMHEDDAALKSLLYQAEERLGTAVPPQHLSDLPLYLCIGPEGSGKTSVLQNCGLDATLVAGQVSGGGAATIPTRVANIWLGQQALFLEIGGRIFNCERPRIVEFLGVLRNGLAGRGWRALMNPRKQLAVDVVLLFVDAREFTGTPEPSKLDRATQQVRERLAAIGAVFGQVPVYVLFTKVDSIQFFADYFGRLSEPESGQVFGTLTSEDGAQAQDRVWAEAATKRLGRNFQTLFLRLNWRRILALTQETEAPRKPSIYEFPREFKKIRTPLVQFLVEIFKPDPLNPAPLLRGFFFIGTRKVERVVRPEMETQRAYRPLPPGADATQFFTPGMTTFGDPAALRKSARPESGVLFDQWIFTRDLFARVLRQDKPGVKRPAERRMFGRYHTLVSGAAVALAAIIALLWTVSWIGNLQLAGRVESAVDGVLRSPADLSMGTLNALDRLRGELQELEEEDSWSLHWGLYTGDALRESARRAYFGQLKRVSLDRVNQLLAFRLQQAGQGNPPETTAAIYDRLKTHRTITNLGCSVDRDLVSKVLKSTAAEAAPSMGSTQADLLARQFDFYLADMAKNKKVPVALGEDQGAENKARAYLRQAGGLDQRLRAVMAQLRSQIKSIPVSDAVGNYKTVLKGRDDYDGIFTSKGLALFEAEAAKDDAGSGEVCVMGGDVSTLAQRSLDSRARDQLKSMFLRAYADAWREFLASYSVLHYANVHDAVSKLDLLASPTSPLLGIVRLVAVNTNFPPPKADEPSYWDKLAQNVGLNGLLQAKSQALSAEDKARQLLAPEAPLMTTADLARLFQPVRYATPPDLDRLVNDKNKPYIDGLRGLQQGMDGFDRAATAERPAAINQARAALAQARMAHDALADNFSDVGNEGLNKVLSDLLDQPIRLTAALIPANAEVSSVGKKNGELAAMCKDMSRVLTYYPFNPNSQADASINDVANAFQRNEGYVWKYVQKSAVDLVVRTGNEWIQKPDLQGMKVNPDLLVFLNRSQGLTDALFGENTLKFRYVLRPERGSIGFRLILDGSQLQSTDPLQKTFNWPALPGARPGAEGVLVVNGSSVGGFGRFDGLWGVFRLFKMAEERPLNMKNVQWSENRGLGGAAPQPIDPPVKLQILEFPGGADLFNPKFFAGLQCPKTAVSAN